MNDLLEALSEYNSCLEAKKKVENSLSFTYYPDLDVCQAQLQVAKCRLEDTLKAVIDQRVLAILQNHALHHTPGENK